MRDTVIDAELDHFRVDHDKAHLVRRRLIEQREMRLFMHALAAAGRTGDEHMRGAWQCCRRYSSPMSLPMAKLSLEAAFWNGANR